MSGTWHPDEGPRRQNRLGRTGLVVFLAMLSAFVPLSTDLYLPALPTMTRYFQVPEYQTNLTLILFFVIYAVATLVWGPLSDRYGRRPVLLVGLSCYTIAGALCAASWSIPGLMVFRVFQAIGAGAAAAVATAIVKDVYEGRKRESILALVQSMVVISPAVAPIVGALVLNLTSWRGVFVVLAILGAITLAFAFVFEETQETIHSGSVLHSLRRLGIVLQNRAFTQLLLIFSLVSIAGMAFISSSSYIYQETFGVSSQVFSFFFAIWAVGLAVGPQIYMGLSRRLKRTSIISGCFVVVVASGLLVLLVGGLGPWVFIMALLPAATATSALRPPATYLMLDQHEGDAGSASALMTSAQMMMGSFGMIIVSVNLGSRVELIGLLHIALGLLCGSLWLGRAMPLLARSRSG